MPLVITNIKRLYMTEIGIKLCGTGKRKIVKEWEQYIFFFTVDHFCLGCHIVSSLVQAGEAGTQHGLGCNNWGT
jgi:hypothetical protein